MPALWWLQLSCTDIFCTPLHSTELQPRDNLLLSLSSVENFMFTANDESGDLKLLDFGFSRTYLQGEHQVYNGHCPHMSPEVFMPCWTSSRRVGGRCMHIRPPIQSAPLVEEIARWAQDHAGSIHLAKELPGFEVGDEVRT